MIIFNEVNLADYVDIIDIRRDIAPPKDLILQQVSGMRGSYLSRVETLHRQVEVDVFFNKGTLPELRMAVREFSGIINTDEPKKMVFTDEPDVYFYGILTGQTPLEEVLTYGKATLSFLLPDPIAWGKKNTKSLNIQTDSVVFTRASKAISPDKVEVLENVPRFNIGKFGKALLLEDGTINSLPNADNLSGYTFKTYTVNNTETTNLNGIITLKFSRTTGTGDCRILSPIIDVVPSSSYVYSFDIKQISGIIDIRIEGNSVSSTADGTREVGSISETGVFTPLKETSLISVKELGDGFKRYSVLIPSTFFYKATGTKVQIQNTHGFTVNGNHEYQFRNPQMEPDKLTSTSFTVVERKKEVLRIPLAYNLSGKAGTWEHRFFVDKTIYPSTDLAERFVWNVKTISGSNAISLGVTGGQFKVSVANTNYNVTLINGWNDISVAWSSAGLLVVVNGVVAHNLPTVIVADNFIGSGFIGADDTGFQANTAHDCVRLSNVAKTAESLQTAYNKAWIVDSNTTFLMNFTDNLDWEGGEVVEVNTFTVAGTSKTSPIFKVKSLNNTQEFKITLDTGEFLRVATAIKANDLIIIDCTKNLVTINGKRAMEFLDLDSRFFELNLGVNTITLTEGLSAEVTIVYSERWS